MLETGGSRRARVHGQHKRSQTDVGSGGRLQPRTAHVPTSWRRDPTEPARAGQDVRNARPAGRKSCMSVHIWRHRPPCEPPTADPRPTAVHDRSFPSKPRPPTPALRKNTGRWCRPRAVKPADVYVDEQPAGQPKWAGLGQGGAREVQCNHRRRAFPVCGRARGGDGMRTTNGAHRLIRGELPHPLPTAPPVSEVRGAVDKV